MTRTLILLATLGIVAPAHAEDAKSLTTARTLSGVGTGASAAIILSSFFVGGDDAANRPVLITGLATALVTPSLGGIYAGTYFTAGMAIRLGAAGLFVYSLYGQREEVRCDSVEYRLCKQYKNSAFVTLGLAAIAFIGGAAYDIKELPDFVADANARRVAIVPTLLPTRGGEIAPGLAANLHF